MNTKSIVKDKTIIFYANPNMQGHCATILKEVQTQLDAKNKSYLIINLDKEKYDPVMHKNEHYTSGGYIKSKQTQKYIKLINDNTTFIFIHPVWWNSMPAILKGFFDKVFAGRTAFRYKKYPLIPFAIPIGLWKGKRAIVISTTGAQNWMTWCIQGSRSRKIIVKDTLKFCGFKAKGFTLYNCNGAGPERQGEVKHLVRRGLHWLY